MNNVHHINVELILEPRMFALKKFAISKLLLYFDCTHRTFRELRSFGKQN